MDKRALWQVICASVWHVQLFTCITRRAQPCPISNLSRQNMCEFKTCTIKTSVSENSQEILLKKRCSASASAEVKVLLVSLNINLNLLTAASAFNPNNQHLCQLFAKTSILYKRLQAQIKKHLILIKARRHAMTNSFILKLIHLKSIVNQTQSLFVRQRVTFSHNRFHACLNAFVLVYICLPLTPISKRRSKFLRNCNKQNLRFARTQHQKN